MVFVWLTANVAMAQQTVPVPTDGMNGQSAVADTHVIPPSGPMVAKPVAPQLQLKMQSQQAVPQLDGVKTVMAATTLDGLQVSQTTPTPSNVPIAVQTLPAPNVTGSAIPTTPVVQGSPSVTATPPKRIEIPVPTLPPSAAVTGSNLVLPLNKTVGIDLEKDIRDVIIGNPDIADVVVRSQKQIYLIGKKTGDTNVFFTDVNGNMIRNIDIVVQPDVDGIQSNIGEMLPGERIAVKGMGDSVVLLGTATSDGVAAKGRDIARRFVAGDGKDIGMVRVTAEQP